MVGACYEKRGQPIQYTNIPHKRTRKKEERPKRTWQEEVPTGCRLNKEKQNAGM